MNDFNCTLFFEELVEEGYPKIGGICPDCMNKVSKHKRRPHEGENGVVKYDLEKSDLEKIQGPTSEGEPKADLSESSNSLVKSRNNLAKSRNNTHHDSSSDRYIYDAMEKLQTPTVLSKYVIQSKATLEIVQGNIVYQNLEAVVNAANENLLHGTGVAGAILSAGGDKLRHESESWIKKKGKVRTGDVAVTNSGNIRGAKKVIHAVGPQVNAGNTPSGQNRAHLRSAIKNALLAADSENLSSIAIPAISCGVFGFGNFLEIAAFIHISAAIDYIEEAPTPSIELIRFVLFDAATEQVFKRTLAGIVTERSTMAYSSSPKFTPVNIPPVVPPLAMKKASCKENDLVFIVKEKSIQNDDSGRFAAAGLLLYKFAKGTLKVLLGFEYRISERGKVLNVLGGKRDHSESRPRDTAAREFWEESGKIHSKNEILDLIDDKSTIKLWFGPGLYVLYLAKCPLNMLNLDKIYNENKYRRYDASAEMEKLIWVPWDYLIKKETINTPRPEYVARAWRQISIYPLSEFLLKLLTNEVFTKSLQQRHAFDGIITDLANDVKNEVEQTKREKSSGKVPMPSKDWRYKAKIPTAKPVIKSPIVTLKATDKDYMTVISSLPEANKSQVISIRKVEVEHRRVEHEEEERRLGAEVIEVVNPTYHGTPETWRATSIAFKGFDLNQQLNGRACGNGVYSSTIIDTPICYTRGTGSILQLRGLLTNKDYKQNNIFVFRAVKQVLPLYIIDFASVTDDNKANGDNLLTQKAQLQKIEEEKRQELVKESEQIIKKEEAFLEDYKQRFLDAYSYYYDVIKNIKSMIDILLNDLAKSNLNIDADMIAQVTSLNRRFQTERNQFRSSPDRSLSVNPIYIDKRNLLNAIRGNDVIVLSAATGSGKSTQLPQYVIDEVFDANETRKVAVLEPRRCNVIDLCNRVSYERGENMGMEVGYSMGQGDVCTSSTTRIEFMTHGLFINKAIDVEKLLMTYGAVILDEAHERSVQVDLCFALLRRALEYVAVTKGSSEERGLSFKVIIASATLSEDQLVRYKDYLAPLELPVLTGCVYRIGGISFPVQIIYRPEAEPKWDEANSMEATSVLASYATEIALKLIQCSESEGNILVFMPGESVIDNCISRLSNWSIFKNNDDMSSIASVTSTEENNVIHLKINRADQDIIINIGLYAFHGKISESTRSRMESHKKEGQDRIIIFSTNIAETGLTLPNIRYVVDTGLERRVEWNKLTCMQEMRTVRITKSSMNQRLGRAGRVASGICVRLYSKDTAENMGEKSPEIESGMILTAVLIKHKIEIDSDDKNKLTLLEDIPDDGLSNAQTILHHLGALDEKSSITEMGKKLLLLGVDLRLGRFLLACSSNGCLGSGANLAAIVATSNCVSLLPRKSSNNSKPYRATKFLDSSGDHLTLRNIFEAYEKSTNKSDFCLRYGFDITILEAGSRSRNNLSDTLEKLKLSNADTVEVTQDKELCRNNLLVSLCSAYFDQIISSNSPGKPSEGFVRVISVEDRKLQRAAAVQIATFGGIRKDDADDDSSFNDDDASTISDLTQDSNTSNQSINPPASHLNSSTYDKVNVSKNSSLWEITATQQNHQQQLGVFSSIMLTDTTRGMVAQLISYVLEEHIKEGSSDWYEKTRFNSLAENLSIIKRSIPISSSLANYLMKSNVLNKNFNKFLSIHAHVNKTSDTNDPKTRMLEVSAPAFAFSHIERRLNKLQSENAEEEVSIAINNLSELKNGFLVNFFARGELSGASHKKEFVDGLNTKILSGLGGDEGFIKIHPNDLGISSNSPTPGTSTVTLRLHGPSKQFSSLIIGEVQSEATRQCAVTEIGYNGLSQKDIGSLINNLAKNEEKKKTFIVNLNSILRREGCRIDYDINNIGIKTDKSRPGFCNVYGRLLNHLNHSNTITEAIRSKVDEVLRTTTTTNRAVPTINNNNGDSYPTVQISANSNLNIYLMQLSTSTPPPASRISDRNATMLYIAHAAVWKGKCCVYGGFIRDLLINGKEPNDIDVGFESHKVNKGTIREVIVQAASSINVRILNENTSKGMAHAITFQGIGKAFDVDLVDMGMVRANSESPGVDCDVGNMVIEVSDQNVFGMQLKVKDRASLLSLAVSQKHCKEQSFVLYYSKDAKNVQGRLNKYFKKNWTCLTQLEEPLLSWAHSNGFSNLLKPKAEFSIPYYRLP